MEGVETEGPPAKRAKKKKIPRPASNEYGGTATYSYHPEDEQIQHVST